MSIAARTPEGEPYRCPICGASSLLETSDAGDSLCPQCGQLLWRVRDSLEAITGNAIESLSLTEPLAGHLEDSFAAVELVMKLEDTVDVEISEAEFENIKTVADVIRWIRRRLRDQASD